MEWNFLYFEKKKNLCPLFFRDGVQLPQGHSHFEEAVYFLPFISQKERNTGSQKGKSKVVACGNTVKISVTNKEWLVWVAFRTRVFFNLTTYPDNSDTESNVVNLNTNHT